MRQEVTGFGHPPVAEESSSFAIVSGPWTLLGRQAQESVVPGA